MSDSEKQTIWGKAKKKPVVIQFREVIPNNRDMDSGKPFEQIQTREGVLRGYPDKDFVIKGVEGEIYPITKTTFYKTYNVLITTDGTVLKGYHDVEDSTKMSKTVPEVKKTIRINCYASINGKGTADEIKFGSLAHKRFG